MLTELESTLKKVLLAGIGAVAVTAEKADEIIRELVKKGEITVEQGKVLNEELKHRAQEAAKKAQPTEPLAAPPKKAPEVDVGAMSREEREALKKKIEELEAKEGDGKDNTF